MSVANYAANPSTSAGNATNSNGACPAPSMSAERPMGYPSFTSPRRAGHTFGPRRLPRRTTRPSSPPLPQSRKRDYA